MFIKFKKIGYSDLFVCLGNIEIHKYAQVSMTIYMGRIPNLRNIPK